ncbi:TPA: lytic transglycosylase domain-containing protein [Vibrio vulnificus]|uniref:Lytic transglycosylase domain-containing protein n=1 Tax=Vibrio vulnificus TaxID=672 RepID=A0A8H9N1E7_VIBVL|nr:lytic transglycosylase domain-containing protein [Vibrio vulnificus]
MNNAMGMYERYNSYSPFIRDTAKRYEVPPEIVVLAAIESSFNPLAKSTAGAVGMWQFLVPTAREFGLAVDENVDERLDWQKSTIAAVKYLKWLAEEKLNNDYETAIIAYNYGIGNTLKAISRARSSNAWVLINADFVPEESANHLMRFLIYIEIFNYLDSTV